MTRRDALKGVSAGLGGAAIGVAALRWRVDACLRCGPGAHVKRIAYKLMKPSGCSAIEFTDGPDEEHHGYVNVTISGIDRQISVDENHPRYVYWKDFRGSPEWRCYSCGRAWGYASKPSANWYDRFVRWLFG